jgi:hypothetical protein
MLTFPASDLFIAGPVVATLDETGQLIDDSGNLGVTLPATDSPNMNPTGWAWTVKVSLTGVAGTSTFAMLLPKDTPNGVIDLADVTSGDPTTPNYVPVPGPSAYDVAVKAGFNGTTAQWLASLKGSDGIIGRDGLPGLVQSVNGKSAASITLVPSDVGAIAATDKGVANGVASLGSDGKVPSGQLPSFTSPVTSVNTKTGAVVLVPSDVGAVATTALGAASGVATLDGTGKLTSAQKPTYTAAEVSAIATTAKGAASGVAGLGADSRVPVAQLPLIGQVTAVKKSTEYAVTANVTPTTDAELTIPVVANAVYDVELACAWTNGGGGFRGTWSGPTGASMVWTDNDGVGVTTLGGNVTFSGTTGTTFKGTLTVGATAGSLAFQWAQSTSNAAATTLRAGCALILLRIL